MKPSANLQYKNRAKEIRTLLSKIENGLIAHEMEQANNPSSWAFTGDLAYLVEELQNASDFINQEGQYE